MHEIARFGVLAVALSACGSPSSSYRERHHALLRQLDPQAAVRAEAELTLASTLQLGVVVEAVLARNPSIEAARESWKALIESAPQAGALDDPTLAYDLAPLSIGAADVRFGNTIMLSQPLPWSGKRGLRADIALAEAESARHRAEGIRIELAAAAASLYFERFVLERALEANRELEDIVADLEQIILRRVDTGRAFAEDVAATELARARLSRDRLALEARRSAIDIQLNRSMHRSPRAALPPTPAELALPPFAAADETALRDAAMTRRPELLSRRAQLEAERTRVALGEKEGRPDFRLNGQYSSMWAETEHQFMVGVAMTLPIFRERRRAAVAEAEARAARAEAEIRAEVDEVAASVAAASVQLDQGRAMAEVVRDRLLPAARARVDALRAGLDSGRTGFVDVLGAERELRELRLEWHQSVAAAWQGRVELDRALGRVPGTSEVSP